MPSVDSIYSQFNSIVTYLVEIGLSSDQNFIFRRDLPGNKTELTFPQSSLISIAMKNLSYIEIYDAFASERAYLVKMPDGALLQLSYLFNNTVLEQHRLAFLPSPHLEEFQNNPDLYLEDDLYADVVSRNIVPFPLRFDYDIREGICEELLHPKSHLTLGQYEHCRIPVSSAISPSRFIDFILRNFYNTAFLRYEKRLPIFPESFDSCILSLEKKVVHIQIPD